MTTAHSPVCRSSVRNVSVQVESPSSVTVSWLPPEAQLWNGIISRYTIVYDLLGMVDKYEDHNDLEPYTTQMLSIPQPGQPLANNPDPRIVMLPLQLETAVISALEEFYVYQFTVYLENTIGQSEASNVVTVEMPASGMESIQLQYLLV